MLEYEKSNREELKMKTNTPVTYNVVTLSSIPPRLNTPKTTKTSRYHDAIQAATKYTKRAILLNTPELTTPKQAMIARYSVLSALKSRKLEKTVMVLQRGAKLYLRRTTGAKTPKTPVTA